MGESAQDVSCVAEVGTSGRCRAYELRRGGGQAVEAHTLPARKRGMAALRGLTITAVIFAIVMAWMTILCWYAMFGLLVVPYRLLRRGQRKRKREELRHRETLAALERGRYQP
jgi:hypothetical protein